MSKVVVIRYSNDRDDFSEFNLNSENYAFAISNALAVLSEHYRSNSGILDKFISSGNIGLKTNCLTGRLNSTPIGLVKGLQSILNSKGVADNSIVIWERSNRELKKAGYELNASSRGIRCLGTDAEGMGYGDKFFSHGKVNSLVSQVLTNLIRFNINLPVLKDHSIAGLSGALKNMYGAIHNPNKYHADNCDPFVADINSLAPIKNKSKLNIIDAVKIQYNGGPGYDSRYFADYKGLIVSEDPVAADRIGLEIVKHFRMINRLPSLEKAGRPAKYLQTAESYGLGLADLAKIDLVVLQVSSDGDITRNGSLFDG